MNKSFFTPLLYSVISFSMMALAHSAPVTFKATVKTTENGNIPSVYVKIYVPGEEKAIDSLFSNSAGYIEQVLPFTYNSGSSSIIINNEDRIIIKNLHPNLITQKNSNYSLEYNYPGEAKIFFINLHGRTFTNNSELPAGIYFHYLRFDDGRQSELNKMVVAEKSKVNVDIFNVYQENKEIKLKSFSNSLADVDVFYAEFIKWGYVTKRDTIIVDSTVIEKNYQLTVADIPTASFTYSGNMKTGNMVLFDASVSAGAHGESLTYLWDFGNGKRGQSTALPHMYSIPGEYNVSLTVAGEYGASHTVTQTITITSDTISMDYTGKVTGYVTDANLVAVENATVFLIEGDSVGYTDSSGTVELSGMPVGVPIHLKITKTGYVNQVVILTVPNDRKEALFFTTLKNRNTPLTLANVEFGGEITGMHGASVELPVEGLIKEDGSFATENVSISITPVDVAYESHSFPGTFRAFRNDGEDGVLLSYGASEFNFQQGEEELQLAAGKKASIVIPIYTSGAHLGDQIALWSINEDNGNWFQEGMGTVVPSFESPTGLALRAEVGHFTWWNCDDFDEDRDLEGECYTMECIGDVCSPVGIDCYFSGGRNDLPAGYMIAGPILKKAHAETERSDIPPVIEVRDFIPESGKRLFFPVNNDVYVRARSFGENGEIYAGEYTVTSDYMLDTFAIELKQVDLPDTSATLINLDTFYEHVLWPTQTLKFKITLPEDDKYDFLIDPVNNISQGHYSISNETGEIKSGSFVESTNRIFSVSGQLNITFSGNNSQDEFSFKFALFRDDSTSVNIGDTIINKIEYKYDTDIISFTGQVNDVVYFKGIRTGQGLSYGRFDLKNATNEIVATKHLANDAAVGYNELIYKLPATGKYSLIVYTTYTGDTGSYQLILNKPVFDTLYYNALNEKNITAQNRYNYILEVPSGKSTHISVIANNSIGGYFHIYNENGEWLTLNHPHTYYTNRYYAYNTSKFPAGKYYIRFYNDQATLLNINIWEAMPIPLNNKGMAGFTDTIRVANSINVFQFSSAPGDGIHAIIKKVTGQAVPANIELKYHQLYNNSNSPAYLTQNSLGYESLDSSILDESSVRINSANDSVLVLVVNATSAGVYEFNFNHVAAIDSVVVDNDYNEYPGAHTSSLVAASLAVKDNGKIFVANGQYESSLPVVIYSNGIDFKGQSKENTLIKNVFKSNGVYVIDFRSNGGSLHDVSLSCHKDNYYSLSTNNQNITISNINIIPLDGNDSVTCGMSSNGDNAVLRNITILNSVSGIRMVSDNGLLEHCSIDCDNSAVYASGDHITIKNNTLVTPYYYRAIEIRSNSGQGNHLVDSNHITIGAHNTATSNYGVIEVTEYGNTSQTNTTYIRNNTIVASNTSPAFYATVYRPPSKIIIENNNYKCYNNVGGKALSLNAGYTSWSSSIIVRNNVFDGLKSHEAIYISGASYIHEDERFAIYNNNFRIKPTSLQADTNFIYVNAYNYNNDDTAHVYFVNNIFEGNGHSYFIKCNADFYLHSDYNTVYNFSKYVDVNGNLAGTTNDILTDPLYTDEDLHINPASPAINHGVGPSLFEDIPGVDKEGIARPQGAGYDIGAYETD